MKIATFNIRGNSRLANLLEWLAEAQRRADLQAQAARGADGIWLEMRLKKDEILTRYMNTVYLGAGA